MFAPRASASTSSGCAYSRSIRSRTRRSHARSLGCCAAAGLLVTCEIVPRRAGVAGVAPHSASALARSAPLTSPTCLGPEVSATPALRWLAQPHRGPIHRAAPLLSRRHGPREPRGPGSLIQFSIARRKPAQDRILWEVVKPAERCPDAALDSGDKASPCDRQSPRDRSHQPSDDQQTAAAHDSRHRFSDDHLSFVVGWQPQGAQMINDRVHPTRPSSKPPAYPASRAASISASDRRLTRPALAAGLVAGARPGRYVRAVRVAVRAHEPVALAARLHSRCRGHRRAGDPCPPTAGRIGPDRPV